MEKFALSTMHNTADLRLRYFSFHAVPGFMIFLQGLWLATNVFRQHYRNRLTRNLEPFRSQLWYAGPFIKYVPLDSLARCLLCVPAIWGQIYSSCLKEDEVNPENMQHAILFFSMFLSSLLEVLACLSQYLSATQPCSFLVVPSGVDRAASILTSVVTFFVFFFHFHNEVPLQTHLHSFLNWFTAMLVLAHLAELQRRHEVWMALMRPYVLLVVGQWGCQIGFVLYFPIAWPRNWDDSSNASIVTCNFLMCCHLVIAFLVLLLVALSVYLLEARQVKKHSGRIRQDRTSPSKIIQEQFFHSNLMAEEEKKLLQDVICYK